MSEAPERIRLAETWDPAIPEIKAWQQTGPTNMCGTWYVREEVRDEITALRAQVDGLKRTLNAAFADQVEKAAQVAALTARGEALEAALRRIAGPHSCGCRPCYGHSERDAIADFAADALAALTVKSEQPTRDFVTEFEAQLEHFQMARHERSVMSNTNFKHEREKRQMQWAIVEGYSPEILGYIPKFLNANDQRSAKEQLHANYSHGGGWNKFDGFKLNREKMQLEYPGDPPTKAVAITSLRDEVIIVFQHAWVAVVQKDGSFEAARMD